MKSNLFFLILPTLCCLVYQAHAQCNNVSLALASAPSDCYQSGSITVQVSGTDAANLNLTTAQYSLEAVPNTGTPAPVNWQTWADPTTRTVSGGVLAQVSAGTYRVKMQAFCLANAVPTIIESNSTITVGGNYTEPDAYITANIRKTFVCTERFIGRIPIAVSGGRMPYTITMTSHPAAYTATTTFTRNTAGTEEINNLPAGNYSFTVSDNCGYTIAGLTATITTFAADFIPEMIYPWAYMPLAADANCDSIRIQTHNIENSAHELRGIYGPEFYEVGFVYNGNNTTRPTTWYNVRSIYNGLYYSGINIPLPAGVDRHSFRYGNPQPYMAAWARIKGTNCAAKITEVKANTSSISGGSVKTESFTDKNCAEVEVTHAPHADTYYLFCWPVQYCIVNPTAPYDTIIPWSGDIWTTNLSSTTMPYGSQIVYRNAHGIQFKTTIRTSMLNSVSMQESNNSISSLCQIGADANGYFATNLYLFANGGFPVGTHIDYVSGPAGAPAPALSHIEITTSGSSYIYPYSRTAPGLGAPNPPYLVPGTYRFRVTAPGGCDNRIYSYTPTIYRLSTPLKIDSTKESCNGLLIYPSGQLQRSKDGQTWENVENTSFSIHSAPTGVSASKAGAKPGSPILLPASGTYAIRVNTDASATSNCAWDTIHYTYEKKPLSLNTGATVAHACDEHSTGYIHVKAIHGSGDYTYRLMPQGGGTAIQENSSGIFSHGTAGDTYTIQATDNQCGTSFRQDVTIRDLSTDGIAYTTGGADINIFCNGQAIRLNCLTLGSATYTWTGPDNWTSAEQNPTIPSATLDMTGNYTVTAYPEGCTGAIEKSVYVWVSPCAAVVNPHLRSNVK